MREPPPHVSAETIVAALKEHWNERVEGVDHLPLGFGAHHWVAHDASRPRLFVTLDGLEPKRTAERLEAAYAGAAALHDAGLDFVHSCLPDSEGRFTARLVDGALSVAPWREGTSGGDLDLPWTMQALRRLHAATLPPGLPPWAPLVGPDLAQKTAVLASRPWGPGPYADRARDFVRDRLADLERWTGRYHHLATVARTRRWVPTHGEPHSHNQMLTPAGRILVDWESLKLAPAELDLRTLAEAGVAPAELGADPEMLELFDLEWRLDEINQYAAWFAAPHDGTADDEIAFDGLLHELTRPG